MRHSSCMGYTRAISSVDRLHGSVERVRIDQIETTVQRELNPRPVSPGFIDDGSDVDRGGSWTALKCGTCAGCRRSEEFRSERAGHLEHKVITSCAMSTEVTHAA